MSYVDNPTNQQQSKPKTEYDDNKFRDEMSRIIGSGVFLGNEELYNIKLKISNYLPNGWEINTVNTIDNETKKIKVVFNISNYFNMERSNVETTVLSEDGLENTVISMTGRKEEICNLLDHVKALEQENIQLRKENVILKQQKENNPEALETRIKNLEQKLDKAIVLPEPQVPLPDKAPILWEDWKKNNPKKDILEFLNKVWGKWLKSNSIQQDIFKDFDSKGLKRLQNFCQRKDVSYSVSDIIPPKSERIKIEKQWFFENKDKIKRIFALQSLISQQGLTA